MTAARDGVPGEGRLVAVTGATGYIGGRLVPRLLEAGWRVRCLARDPTKLAGCDWAGDVEVVRADVLDPAGLTEALSGAEAAFYLVHSMAAGGGFQGRDLEAARNFASAVAEARLERLVYLGGLGSGPDLSAHLRSRQQVGGILRAGPVPAIELRAAIVIGGGSASFEMLRALVERLPFMVCPRWVRTRCQPIAIADVLDGLRRALEIPAVSRIVEIGGADALSYREMMLEYARIRGLRRTIVTVPLLTPRLSAYWVDLVTPIPAAYARPLIEGLSNEVVVTRPDETGLVTWSPLGYRDAVRRALLEVSDDHVATSWTGAGLGVRGARQKPTASVDLTGDVLRDERVIEVEAPAETLAAEFMTIGGRKGWFYGDWLWGLRGLLDRTVGGVGMRRGRRHPRQVRPGDALDFWRVESAEPGRRLRLRAEMKVPGTAHLEFVAEPLEGGRSRLRQTATLSTRSWQGRLYWRVLAPVHGKMFGGMASGIAAAARRAAPDRPAGEAQSTGSRMLRNAGWRARK
jgi:uncharacterized protein YbjT (DUF2867 family)